ncbi:MAG: aminotransferase class I/II-fold pyridoxal phosphate-dependent enzyme, partial [Leptospiraceae bacterium]|nr:aminotransferase class I/II-fold pyridoxal phosphate-dependent enzyme [Leptospiraceae bacterium]
YINMVYNGKECTPISEVVGDVPAIALRGISKEFPWPGGRCGWMEVYNHHRDPMFELYIASILNAKMLEVSSTTLPQAVIPEVMSHPEYANWQRERNEFFERRSQAIGRIFADCPGVIVNPPDGAFYVSVVFDRPLTDKMRLSMPDRAIADYIDRLCPSGVEPDRKFVYQLLGSKNICVVPLSSFVTDLRGFRCTLLEKDDAVFEETYRTIAESIQEFLASDS